MVGITDSMDMNLNKLHEIVKNRGVWHAVVHGFPKSQTQLSDWRRTTGHSQGTHQALSGYITSVSTCCAQRHSRPTQCFLPRPGPGLSATSANYTHQHKCAHTLLTALLRRGQNAVGMAGQQPGYSWCPRSPLVLITVGTAGKRYEETSPFTEHKGKWIKAIFHLFKKIVFLKCFYCFLIKLINF